MIALLLASLAHAQVPSLYGMGAANIGRAGASTALADDAWAAFYNPAGLARQRQITLSLGWIGGQADLRPFDGIVFDADGDGDTTDENGFAQTGRVGTDYRVRADGKNQLLYTNGLQVALSYPLWKFASIGLAAYIPNEGLLRVQLQDPAIPYYVMYRNRNSRFSIHPALAIQPVDGISLGFGAQIGGSASISVQAAANADIIAFPEGETSGTELQADITAQVRGMEIAARPSIQPALGAQILFGAFVPASKPELKKILDRMAVGVSYRGPWRVDTVTDISAQVHGTVTFDDETVLIEDLLEQPLHVAIDDLAAFATPPEINLGLTGGYGGVQLSVDAQWAKWSGFRELTIPATNLSVDSIAGASIDVSLGGELPPPAFRDTWSVRAGLDATTVIASEVKSVGDISVRGHGGYAWVPTPVPDQTGLTNYMDANRHVGALGLGLELSRIDGFSRGPVRFDLGMQLHSLVERTSVKRDGLIVDSDEDGRLEYPSGYPWAGSITAGGRTWVIQGTLEFLFGDPTTLKGMSRGKGTRKKRGGETL